MRALVYHGARSLRVEDVPVPEVGAKDVLVRVLFCGVCGTDIHIYNGEGGAHSATPPLIMGHEFSGVVERVGAGVRSVAPGDLVTVDPNAMCGECYFCRNGMQHFCTNNIAYGVTRDGGFAEYAACRESAVYKYRQGTDPLLAAMTEPLSCCLHGIDLCHIRTGDEVLVIGGGPIGLMNLQLAKMGGASKVILSEPVEEKRALALELGADLAIDPIRSDVKALLAEHCKNVNVVIECVGSVRTIADAVDWAGMGATVMMFGLTGPDAELVVKPDVIFKKELKLTSSFINPYSFERAIAIIESGRVRVTETVSTVVGLEDAVRVFEDEGLRRTGKAVIKAT